MHSTARVLIAGLALLSAVALHPANAEPHHQPATVAGPINEGYFGVGHEQWHDLYKTLHNQDGTSCCDGTDCRPTIAKLVNKQWFAKLDGEWKPMLPYTRVVEAPFSWSETAHVCASPIGVIYCFIPTGALQ